MHAPTLGSNPVTTTAQNKPVGKEVELTSVKPEVKSSGFSVPMEQMKEMRHLVPEDTKAEPVKLEKTYFTLLNTGVYHFGKLAEAKKILTTTRFTDFQEEFYQTLQGFNNRQQKKFDLSKSKELEACVDAFLKQPDEEMRGKAVRMVFKLAQLEVATMQGATGGMYTDKDVKGKQMGQVAFPKEEKEVDIVLDETTLEPIVESTTKPWIKMGPIKFGKVPETVQVPRQLRFEGAKHMYLTSNSLLSSGQVEFLKACGYKNGDLSSDEMISIKKRMLSLVALEREMYAETGFKTIGVKDLNFIRANYGTGFMEYVDFRKARLLGEKEVASGGNLRNILEAEGMQISTEIKAKVQKEFDERMKKEKEEVYQRKTVEILKQRLEEMKKSSGMSDKLKELRTAEIKAEIAKLGGDLEQLYRARSLPGDIKNAQKERDDLHAKLTEVATQSGISVDKLIDLTDPSSPDSFARAGKKLQDRQKRLEAAKAELKSKEDVYNALTSQNPGLFSDTTKEDKQGNKVTQKKFEATDPQVQKLITRIDAYEDLIRALEREIGDDTKGLIKEIKKLTDEYDDVKSIVEDNADTKALAGQYHTANNKCNKLSGSGAVSGEIDDVSKVIVGLVGGGISQAEVKAVLDGSISDPTRAGVIRAEIEKKGKEINKAILDKNEEIAHLGEFTGKDKLDVQVIEALVPLYEKTGVEARNNRVRQAESDGIVTHSSPEWDHIPPAIRRIVHLLYGDEVMYDPQQKEMADKIRTLLSSKDYLDDVMSPLEALRPGASLSNLLATQTYSGYYDDLKAVLLPAYLIWNVDATKIDSEIMKKVIDNLQKRAVNLSTI